MILSTGVQSLAVALMLAALVCLFVWRSTRLVELPITSAAEQLTYDADDGDSDPADNLGNDLIVDIASRYNESLVQNLDALDIALLTILGVDVAFSVFAVDKIFRLDCASQTYAIDFIAGSVVASLLGYAVGILGAPRDGIKPGELVADLAERGTDALGDAVRELVRNGEKNLGLRLVKRILAVTAVVLFLVGAEFVVVPVLAAGPIEGSHLPRNACKVVHWY